MVHLWVVVPFSKIRGKKEGSMSGARVEGPVSPILAFVDMAITTLLFPRHLVQKKI